MSVTCVLGYLPTNFGLPSTFGSRVIHYVRDRQTDGQTDGQKQRLMPPYPTGGGIIKSRRRAAVAEKRSITAPTVTVGVSCDDLGCCGDCSLLSA